MRAIARFGRFNLLGGALSAVVVLVLLTAATAFAVEWQEAGKKLAKAQNVVSRSVGATHVEAGKILFGDAHLGIAVECDVSDTGTVGPGAVDSISTFTTINCAIAKAGGGDCDSAASVDAFGLPWRTELYEEGGGEVRDAIERTPGGGEPRFELICDDEDGLPFDDTCNAETSTGISNEAPGVMASFDGGSGKTSCEGNADDGEIRGNDFISGCPNMTVG